MLGMRRTKGSRLRWARQIATAKDGIRQAAPSEDGDATGPDIGFDLSRPPPPANFPSNAGLDFTLEPDEADFLRNRLKNACADETGQGRQFRSPPPR